jgi:GNAT superfamily N-acetyltransferase
MQESPFSPAELREIQERAVRAQPIEHTEYAGGWRIGRTASDSWWHGSVIPHGEPADLPAHVASVERAYAAWGRRVSFQISPGICPDGLDGLLAARGYRRVGPILLQCAAASEVLAALDPIPLETRVDRTPHDDWLAVLSRVQGRAASRADRANLERLALPSAYASIRLGGRTIGVARAVADSGWTGVFALAVLPEARGRGAGRELIRVLAAWAEAQGMPNLYLQVEAENAPALALYAKAGFTEALTYHYRSRF